MPRYWWVNHKQTVTQERGGNYIWSPKRSRNGRRNPFYEFMREVAPGDVVFSYAHAQVGAIGRATSFAYDFPKPAEFGKAGENWSDVGWRVDVDFVALDEPIRPREHIEAIRPLLPEKYSPLSVKGLGQQNLYLTRLSPRLGMLLEGLAGPNLGVQLLDADRTNEPWTDEAPAALYEWEEQIEKQIATASSLSETERHRLISARMGQGLFRQRVLERERRCRITGVERQIHLVASHCKPWRVANNDERLDGENGLALTPSIDHLFDKGFISFEDNGRLLISPVADQSALARMGVPTGNSFSAGVFSHGQKRYLDYHREMIFKESRVVG